MSGSPISSPVIQPSTSPNSNNTNTMAAPRDGVHHSYTLDLVHTPTFTTQMTDEASETPNDLPLNPSNSNDNNNNNNSNNNDNSLNSTGAGSSNSNASTTGSVGSNNSGGSGSTGAAAGASEKSTTGAVKTVKYQPDKGAASLSECDWIQIPAAPSDPKFANDTITIQIAKSDAAYNLRPIHCGRQVVFLNAQDPAFYKRELPSPSLTVWLLTNMPVSQSHALKRMFESGWRQNIAVKTMETGKFELIASKDGLENVLYEGKPVELPDAVFVRVGANVGYFGMAVIRQLENMGCLMFNNLRSIELSKDKMLTVQQLAAHGLPIPKTLLAKFPLNLDAIKKEFEYPIIIKKASGSQGKGIIKVESHEQLTDLVDMLDTGKPIIFQEYIKASSGKDLRVFVVGGRVVGAMMRIAAPGQFKANVHQGGSVKAVKISSQVEWLVLETVKIIGLDVAGVDLLIDENTYKICEVNSSPGFEGLEKALGENIAIKMFQYMKMRLGVWRRNAKHARMTVTVPIEHSMTEVSNNSNNKKSSSKKESNNSARETKENELNNLPTVGGQEEEEK